MYKSIVQSCDTYYYMLAADLGVDAIHDFMKPLGFGQLTGIDLGGELRGTLPSTAWKRAAYRRPEQKKWYAGETISLGIGQGYNTFTMLQLAQATATVAAGGQRYKPHVVREVTSFEPHKVRHVSGEALPPLSWKPEHVAFIHRAMYGVTQEGTSARAFAGAPYRTGGKTGTAQVIAIGKNEKYKASQIDERHRDHALYIAYRAARRSAHRAGADRRERRLRRAVGGADRAPGVRLRAARQVSERSRPGRDPHRPVDGADRQAARRRRHSAAGAGGGRGRRTGGERCGVAAAAAPEVRRRRQAATRPCDACRRGRRRRRRPPRVGRAAPDRRAMNTVFEQPTLWQRLRPLLLGIDWLLLLAAGLLAVGGLVTMYSAGYDSGTRFFDHARNMLIALVLLVAVAQVPPQRLASLAVPLYAVGVALLVATALFGVTKKGATRWLNIGFVIQPSEVLKIAMPLMLAWWFQRREGRLRMLDFAVALALLAVPLGLIVKQPDLGTAILVLSAGMYVIFFAGLPWLLILPVLLAAAAAIAAVVFWQDDICRPEVIWPLLRDYQKNRVCTLLDPTTDPLGKGFHILQGMIAIGSGGIHGKGFMKGTQTHLEFIPERTTDFVFAAFAEEFGLVGCGLLLAGFVFLIFRGLAIAAVAPSRFSRLLAGAVTLSFFTYAFVNMGMVSGILPVVGVPLPFISYGGTAMVTLGLGLGILMSIANSRRLVPT